MGAAWNDRDSDDCGEQDGSLVDEEQEGWRIDVQAGAARARAFTTLPAAASAFEAITTDLAARGAPGDVQLVGPGGRVLARWTVLAALALAALAGCGGAPFSAALLGLEHDAGADDGGALEAGQDAPDPVDGSTTPDASADAREGGVDAGPAHDAGEAGSVVDSGAADAGPACTCVTDLSGIGLADFWIAFDLRTTWTGGSMAILDQRTTCDSSRPFVDVFTGANASYGLGNGAAVFVALGDGSPAIDEPSTQGPAVNDGATHHVLIARTGGGSTLTLQVDGHGAAQASAPMPLPAGLPPLQVGTNSACGWAPLAGSLTNVCISVGCALQ